MVIIINIARIPYDQHCYVNARDLYEFIGNLTIVWEYYMIQTSASLSINQPKWLWHIHKKWNKVHRNKNGQAKGASDI